MELETSCERGPAMAHNPVRGISGTEGFLED